MVNQCSSFELLTNPESSAAPKLMKEKAPSHFAL
jgi:hypothetical protein